MFVLITRRYFGGEDLLFPHSARTLQVFGEHLAAIRDLYRITIGRRPPESEEGSLRWLVEEPPVESLDTLVVPVEDLSKEHPATGGRPGAWPRSTSSSQSLRPLTPWGNGTPGCGWWRSGCGRGSS